MRGEFNKYGKRLTEQEMIEAYVQFWPQSGKISAAMRADLNKKETNLMIDQLLGVEYPAEKRDLLCQARERAYHAFTRNPSTILKSIFVSVAQRLKLIKGVPDFDEGSLGLAGRVLAAEFTKEKTLDTEDIIQFLGPESEPYVRKLRPL